MRGGGWTRGSRWVVELGVGGGGEVGGWVDGSGGVVGWMGEGKRVDG